MVKLKFGQVSFFVTCPNGQVAKKVTVEPWISTVDQKKNKNKKTPLMTCFAHGYHFASKIYVFI
jgi:hypothetical protein